MNKNDWSIVATGVVMVVISFFHQVDHVASRPQESILLLGVGLILVHLGLAGRSTRK